MTKIAFSKMSLSAKIPPGDDIWPKFNASFENLDIDTLEIANLIYTGHPFTTWHKDHWRHSKNYQLGQHIGIDLDTEDERSSISYLAKDKFVQKYASIVYTTPSHTPEAPRARVLFLLDTPIVQPANYVLAVSSLLWMFGTGDRQCKDAVRFFYGSTDCEMEYIDSVLPLSTIKTLIGQYQTTGQTARKAHERGNYTPTTDQTEAADALKKIPAWQIDYSEWVSVLMGLHSEFGDAGLPLAMAWADGLPGEVEKKWKGFQPGRGVSIASMYGIAKRFGWTKTQRAV